jgi:glyoxylase-like metal-dependent hydrolase (beta-lactamase superfamily II)
MRMSGVNRLSRRAFLSTASVAAAGVWAGGRLGWAQSGAPDRLAQQRAAAATATITVQPLRAGVSVVMGSGGNIAVLANGGGKLLVDSEFSTSKPVVMKALDGISGDPLKVLVNTHWHADHTDGNVYMHEAGATICALTKTRERLSTTQRVEAFNMTVPALPAGGLPTVVFDETKTLNGNGATVQLKRYVAAHTDTDISVHFVEAEVLHAGDTWFNGFYPFIDYSTGGNIDGMIKAAEWTLGATNGKTIIIPGHGPVGDREQLVGYYTMLGDCRDKVAGLKKQGKTLAEVQAAKPTAGFDEKWGGGNIKTEMFVGLVYQGV